jgi:hypothetical protein
MRQAHRSHELVLGDERQERHGFVRAACGGNVRHQALQQRGLQAHGHEYRPQVLTL